MIWRYNLFLPISHEGGSGRARLTLNGIFGKPIYIERRVLDITPLVFADSTISENFFL